MGGLRAAEAVVKAGYGGEVIVVGAEPHMPYNRPPLSKDALQAEPDLAGLQFRVPRAAKNVRWRLGSTVTCADLDAHTVTLDDGAVLDWRGLVAASGLRPRRLTLPGPSGGRHVLRTVEDALALRASMTPGTRLVVIGAGFVGCEVAATARRLDVEVDVIAPDAVPMNRPLGRELGAALQRRHEAPTRPRRAFSPEIAQRFAPVNVAPAPAGLSADEQRCYEDLSDVYTKGIGYAIQMLLRPQTLYGIADSPVGLAAWMVDHDARSYEDITHAFVDGRPVGNLTRDEVLDNITLTWFTNTGISSARLYHENAYGFFDAKGVSSVPVAVSVFPRELYQAPRSWTEQAYPNLIYYNVVDRGDHFAAWQEPKLFSEEVRAGSGPFGR